MSAQRTVTNAEFEHVADAAACTSWCTRQVQHMAHVDEVDSFKVALAKHTLLSMLSKSKHPCASHNIHPTCVTPPKWHTLIPSPLPSPVLGMPQCSSVSISHLFHNLSFDACIPEFIFLRIEHGSDSGPAHHL
eukprot:592220-Pelagomonas_calceolata.AAC.6